MALENIGWRSYTLKHKLIRRRINMELIVGIALILIVFFSSSIIEKRLKNIEKQNNRVIEILEEIRDKK